MSNPLEQFLANNLTSSELKRLAHPPLDLFLPVHELLKPPMAKRGKKHRPLNRFLLYRRNYAARFPLSNLPPFRMITEGASANWNNTTTEIREYFTMLAKLMKRYMETGFVAEPNGKHGLQHIVVLVHIV